MRRGFSLAEVVLVCAFIGIVAGIALPRTAALLDGVRLRQAAHEVAAAVTLARAAAIRRATYARVVVDSVRGEVRVESGEDTLLRRDLRATHRVEIRATRDTITYAPSGMGYGVANSTVIMRLGARAETVTVSRLGRMRRSW
ncbi:MAG: GspH/FimT family pseudopilin [Gemmatimonadota bacterium]|nr:GspH/FimT family pseudopilin [Gemmatimonadota bacterium]